HAAESGDGLGNDGIRAFFAGNAIVAGFGATAASANFRDYGVRGGSCGSRTVPSAAQIIHQHVRALAREQQRAGSADAVACASYHRDLAVEESHAAECRFYRAR